MGALAELGLDEEHLTQIAKIKDKNRTWMYDNFSKIQPNYSYNFIAIYQEEIVAIDSDQKELFKKLKEKLSEEEIQKTYIHYINPKGFFIL